MHFYKELNAPEMNHEGREEEFIAAKWPRFVVLGALWPAQDWLRCISHNWKYNQIHIKPCQPRPVLLCC